MCVCKVCDGDGGGGVGLIYKLICLPSEDLTCFNLH